jgi:hypothetical protein
MLYIKGMNLDFYSAKFIFTLIFTFFILVYWVFNFIILYHLTRFGIGTQPKKFSAVFLLGSIVLFFISGSLFARLDTSALGQEFANFLNNSNFSITYPR